MVSNTEFCCDIKFRFQALITRNIYYIVTKMFDKQYRQLLKK